MLLFIQEGILVPISNVVQSTKWYFLTLNPYVLQKGFTLIGDSVGTKDQFYALLWKLPLQQAVVLDDLSRSFSGEYASLHFYDDETPILILK